MIKNLAEEIYDYIGICGYDFSDVKVVRARGVNDGILYGVKPEAFFKAAENIPYDEMDESRHVSTDLCLLMKDGSMFTRSWNEDAKFGSFDWHSENDVPWQDKSALIYAEPDEVVVYG